MRKRALITGATTGLGNAFARQLAGEGYDLTIVARTVDKLEEVAKQLSDSHDVDVEVLVADLATDAGMQAVEQRVKNPDAPIDFLVNNAGFGARGNFIDMPVATHDQMLRVNSLAVLRLTHAALGAMVPRGQGDIINVSSVAGFTPGIRPSSTYPATKAFVTALTEGLALSLTKTGVHMSALCPGYVRTEFHKRAGIGTSKLPSCLWLNADDVVSAGLRDHRRGLSVSIPTFRYKVIATLARSAPRSVVRTVSAFYARHTHK